MQLALEFLRGSGAELGDELPGLEARGLARLANAHHLAGDSDSARRYLEEAHEAWQSVHHNDDLVEAEITLVAANLHLTQGELQSARELLDTAIHLCRRQPPGRLLVQCLIQRSTVAGHHGDDAATHHDLRVADLVLADQDEPHLKLKVAADLALLLALNGDVDEAEPYLERARELCDEAGDPLHRQHVFWTQGLIHQARGERDSAVDEYDKAARGFDKLAQPGHTAMVSLDLALMRHQQGRVDDIVGLVARVVPVLEHFDHVAGVSAALRLLRESMVERQVARQALEAARSSLHALWRDPAVDFTKLKD